MAKHKRRLGWSFDKPQNPLVDIDVSFLVTRETWNDVASKGQLSLLRLSIVSNAITNVLQIEHERIGLHFGFSSPKNLTKFSSWR